MAPDGGGKTPHFGNTDSVRGPENPKGVQLLPPGSPFSEAFGLGLRAAGPPSRVGHSQVLCYSGDLDWVVLRLLFERSFHGSAGSDPGCLFKGHLKPFFGEAGKECTRHPEAFSCNLVGVFPAKVDRQVVNPSVRSGYCRLVKDFVAGGPQRNFAQGHRDWATCKHPTTCERRGGNEAVCEEEARTSVSTECSPKEQRRKGHLVRMCCKAIVADCFVKAA